MILHGTVIIMLLTAAETPLFMSLSLGWGNDMKNRDTGKQRLDMLHGSLWDKIPRFALPIAATAILGQLFNAADIAVVGNFAGDVRTQSVAAVGANGAIIGPSGGGKTTLCHLLARFWDVDGGRVTLGGRDVREYDMDSLMQNFSFVFQNVYLFHDTVANNIRFGQPDAPMEKVTEAAKKARCHDFIMKLPQGYDTVIGEAGGSLSGGERQRLSIARAIMKDAPIIILDEATANVDPENEKELMEAIGELTREKTVIMIAHRLKTVRHADQILVVDKGRIVQRGTHDELMVQNGIYRHFITGREQAVGWKL